MNVTFRRRALSVPTLVVAVGCAFVAAALASLAAGAPVVPVAWQEKFDRPPLDWVDPVNNSVANLSRVYQINKEGGYYFLHALYDGTASPRPPAMHYGKAFQHNPPPLSRVRALRWKWRALKHPTVTSDPWIDCAASVYVIIRQPGILKSGRGFKFAWLAHPGRLGTRQHGLLQIPLRTDPATTEWKSESVDLCALYTKEYGAPCDKESVLYIGVMTDGDNTHSISSGDYRDFELEMLP